MDNSRSREQHPWAGLSLSEIFARIEHEKHQSLEALLNTPNGLAEYKDFLDGMTYPEIRAFLQGNTDQG